MFQLPTKMTPILLQGITTEMGAVHVERALAYGGNIVAGTSRDRSVKLYADIPVFGSVKEAVRKTNPAISVVFSTPARALQDTEEAIRARIPTVICTTEHVPLHDILKMINLARKYQVTLIGPSSPGIVRVGECLAGSIPAHLFPKGNIGLIGRSSSLIYESVQQLAEVGLGVSTCLSLGASPLVGTSFASVFDSFLADKETRALLVIGQLTGDFELGLAEAYRKSHRKKPLVVYIPGQTIQGALHIPLLGTESAIPEKIIAEKKAALEKAGCIWISNATELGRTVYNQLKSV
ncbi:MAG: hypothetical protein IJV07_00925 [Alphaproteobacteria bacterium]|nr:hypothetical protein [Alphaproteobacteria bacterium]